MEKISKITYNGIECEVKDAAARDELLQTIQTIQIDGTTQLKSNHIVNLPAYPTKDSLGLSNIENKSSEQIRDEITPENVTNALGYTPLDESEKGQSNGVAQLDDTGRVPAAQLPSYVDDIESYVDMEHFPLAGEDSKIYVDKSTNKTYRWDGTTYVEISASLALGETSSTAYPGDKGAAAYAHAVTNKGNAYDSGFYKISTNSEGHVVNAVNVTKEDILNLGIEDTDTKVTSVDNHYLPVEDAEAAIEIEADGGETAQWGLTNFVKGITLKRDAKGHVVGIDVESSRMPAEPSAQGSYEVVTGDANGQIKVIPPSGNAYNVDVKGLGSAAYTDSSAYATAAQGERADNAITTRAELIDKLGFEPADDDNVVTLVKVGEDEYTPDDGVVSLPAYPTKASLGLDNVENKSVSDILGELDDSNVTDALGYTPATAEQGNKADTAVQTIKINGAIQEKVDNTVDLPAYPTKASLGLDKVENKTADEIIGELTSNDVTDALGYTPATAEQGNKADSAIQTIKIGTETIENVDGTVTLPIYPTKASLGLGSAAELDVPATSGAVATATEAVRGDDPRLSDARPASDVSAWAKESTKPSYSATEVGALSDSTKYGSAIGMELDSTTYEITIQLKDQDGNALGAAQSVDLPLESVVVGGSYDSINKKIVLTLKNGNTVDVPVGDLVAGLQSEITSNNMLDADLVDDTTSAHKFATAAQLAQIATNTSAIEDKADKTDLPSSPSDIGAATAAQGEKADTAVQTIKIGGTTQTKTNGVVNLPAYPTVPTSLKNPYSLTVQGNGTQVFTYDGSSAKTLNIKAGTNITIGTSTNGDITINGAAGTSYDAGTGLSLSGSTFNHSNSIEPGTASGSATKPLSYGGTFDIPTVRYDAQGHVIGKGTTTMTMPAKPTYTKSDVGLGNVDNKSSATIRSEITSSNITTALGYTPANTTSLSNYLPTAGGNMTGWITCDNHKGIKNKTYAVGVQVGEDYVSIYNTSHSLDLLSSGLYLDDPQGLGSGTQVATISDVSDMTGTKLSKTGGELTGNLTIKNGNDSGIVIYKNVNSASGYTSPQITLSNYVNGSKTGAEISLVSRGLTSNEEVDIEAPYIGIYATDGIEISSDITFSDTIPTGTGSQLLVTSNSTLVKQSSSRDVKHDIEYIEDYNNYHNALMNFKPATFIYNGDIDNTIKLGMIAEDVDAVCPIASFKDANGNVENYDDRAIIAMLVLEVQRLNKELEQLKK